MTKYAPCLQYNLSPTHCYPRLKCRCENCVKYVNERWKKTRNKHLKILQSNYKSHKIDYLRRNFKSRLKGFGLTVEEYAWMLYKQNFGCCICKSKESFRILSVDHNHSTGKVRGLLCSNCNTAIGMLKDNKELLSNVIKYLEENDRT